ncbi:response regulator [Sphingobium sp. H39-3-25]|uniref:response regulator transcription factor n=1 Tax=Sphingobium arseniciresistens TaxID=3030834 RepID=UPI0023B93755|nr:response regulator [Sphingobium arseniciresistens]
MAGFPIPVSILDDDAGARRSLQLLLQGRGFQVRSFASPEALIADAKANNPACLVTDYRMAECDGLEVLHRLRAVGWTGRAILVTAFYSADLLQRAMAHGFDAVLDKPCKDSALMHAVMFATMRDTGRERPAP